MKKISALIATGAAIAMMLTASAIPVCAGSLDDVIGDNQPVVVQQEDGNGTYDPGGIAVQPGSNGAGTNNSIVDGMKDATQLDGNNPKATEINKTIKKVASVIIQVLSYTIVVLLTLRVILDILYIAIPFCRVFLANGYQGTAQGGQPGGMGGMSGGMGGGFGGGMGGFGGGMNRGGMGMGGMSGMGGMGGQQQQGAGLKIQWVSNAALNAVASESTPGPNGPQNAFKIYAKDMIIVLVITPIFLVLAVTGALTNLGFVLGDALVDFIAGFGNLA